MWELDDKESWVLKNCCFWTVVLEKTLESPLDCREVQQIHPKGDQCWVFIGRTDDEAETPVLWPPHVKSWLIGKDPDAGKDWGQEEKGTTEDEMAGRHHWLDGSESEWILGVGDVPGGLVCCDSWDCKELDMTEHLNWTEWINIVICTTILSSPTMLSWGWLGSTFFTKRQILAFSLSLFKSDFASVRPDTPINHSFSEMITRLFSGPFKNIELHQWGPVSS